MKKCLLVLLLPIIIACSSKVEISGTYHSYGDVDFSELSVWLVLDYSNGQTIDRIVPISDDGVFSLVARDRGQLRIRLHLVDEEAQHLYSSGSRKIHEVDVRTTEKYTIRDLFVGPLIERISPLEGNVFEDESRIVFAWENLDEPDYIQLSVTTSGPEGSPKPVILAYGVPNGRFDLLDIRSLNLIDDLDEIPTLVRQKATFAYIDEPLESGDYYYSVYGYRVQDDGTIIKSSTTAKPKSPSFSLR